MYAFIFSRNIRLRLARHLAFWGLYGICTVLTQVYKISFKTFSERSLYESALMEILAFLPVYLFSVYISIYYILPRYLASRNRTVLLLHILFLLIISTTAGYFICSALIEYQIGSKPNFVSALGFAMHRCQANMTTITIVAVLIKVMKDDYFRLQENELLAVENIANHLRLLKMQLHPRILFSSLHSIYAEMGKETQRAPRMILKLSDLLSYLLYESDAERVALSKEVGMAEHYIQLKKLEYPESMDIYLDTNAIAFDHPIPPGLFLPILEIGIQPADDPQQPVTIHVQIRTSASKVYFNLQNDGKGIDASKADTVRIAFDQVRTRLQSLLSGKFKLDVLPGPYDLHISMEFEIAKTMNIR